MLVRYEKLAGEIVQYIDEINRMHTSLNAAYAWNGDERWVDEIRIVEEHAHRFPNMRDAEIRDALRCLVDLGVLEAETREHWRRGEDRYFALAADLPNCLQVINDEPKTIEEIRNV